MMKMSPLSTKETETSTRKSLGLMTSLQKKLKSLLRGERRYEWSRLREIYSNL